MVCGGGLLDLRLRGVGELEGGDGDEGERCDVAWIVLVCNLEDLKAGNMEIRRDIPESQAAPLRPMIWAMRMDIYGEAIVERAMLRFY